MTRSGPTDPPDPSARRIVQPTPRTVGQPGRATRPTTRPTPSPATTPARRSAAGIGNAPRGRTPGAIPPRHRKLVIGFGSGVFVFILVAGLLLKLVADIDIPWFWIAVTPVFVALLIYGFLWVRLSD
ncbi:hypothetical protein [Nakamurella leprariae]|uniref:Uncharacterized protein n=1 Tax=Nakamurella leprariae TaxID=2803911 RepID=A0A938Y8L6_9ACTN|nr:hypothetical protein [Nakamurella leprariae]MBM9465977.1 hypothetical protein [Nakamurella leprariae]